MVTFGPKLVTVHWLQRKFAVRRIKYSVYAFVQSPYHIDLLDYTYLRTLLHQTAEGKPETT